MRKIPAEDLEILQKKSTYIFVVYLYLSWMTFSKEERTYVVLGTSRHFTPVTIKTVKFGTDVVTHRDLQVWNLVLDNIKNAASLEIFNKKIKKCKGKTSAWRFSKPSLQCMGLIQT